jgi:hypothetical protein
LLLLSLITLFAGPLLFQWLSRSGRVARTLDRIIVAVLVVLVAVFLVPEIIEPLGLAAPALLLLGYFLPSLLENLVRKAAETLHLLSLGVALLGLLLHAVLDGAGLAGSTLWAEPGLAVAIVLHRFGVGLTLWLIFQPVFGARIAWLTLFAMAAATIVGFEFSERLLPYADDTVISAVQGLIVGTIIHGLVHRSHVHRDAHGHG